MTWVKVCGLSRIVEVDAAVASGADAVGFVAVESSPRFIRPEAAAPLVAHASVMTVLLLAEESPEEALAALSTAGVDAVQPYGPGSEAVASAALAAGYAVLQPIRLGGHLNADPWEGATPLYDTHRHDRYGGTGETFDWNLLDGKDHDYIVAGGLGPDNVGDLIRSKRPWGVDASSRLEADPGVKDVGKVSAFVEEAKSA